MDIRQLIWPSYGDEAWPPTADDDDTKRALADLGRVSWGDNSERALALARQVADSEEERRRTAESKAVNCLLVISALIAFLTYLEALLTKSDLNVVQQTILLSLLILVIVYLLAAALWGLRAISVVTYAVVGVRDVARICASEQPALANLIRETLMTTRMNQEVVNWKVTGYRNSYAFLYRAIFLLCLFITVQALFILYLAHSK